MHIRPNTASPARHLLLITAVVLTVVGYFSQSIFDPTQVKALKLLTHVTLILNAIALVIWLIRRDIPFAALVGGGWIAAAIFYAGLGPSAATALFAASAIGLGTLVLSINRSGSTAVMMCGLAILATTVSWTLPFRIHQAGTYFLIGVALVAWRLRSIVEAAVRGRQYFLKVTQKHPWAALFTINVVGICSTPLWLPTMQSDDIAYHLALPTQLEHLSYYRMDIGGSVWALAPWAADVVQAIPQVLAGAESRGVINLMWMLCLYTGMWRLGCRLGLPRVLNLLAIALHASLPIASSMLAGMQTELPSSAIFITLLCLLGERRPLQGRSLAAIAILAGLLLAIKLSNALLLLPTVTWLAVRHWRQFPIRQLPVAVLLGALVTLPSFTYAMAIAGNPFLPFLNGYFESPYAPALNWTDNSWRRDITLLLPWQLTFNTSDYLSATNGAGGFIYIFCAAGVLPGLYFRRTRGVTLIGLAAFAAIFSQIQYIRYTHPATAVLLVAATAGFFRLVRGHQLLPTGMILLCLLNLSVITSGYWHLRHGALRTFVKEGAQATIQKFSPQRAIAAMLTSLEEPNMQVLFHNVDSQGNAELTMPTLTTSWYNPDLAAERGIADEDATGSAWIALMRTHSITHLVTDHRMVTPGLNAALADIGNGIIYKNGIYDVWRINSTQPLEYEIAHTGTDYIKLQYSSRVGSDLVLVDSHFRCSLPGEPIVISLSVRDSVGSKENNVISKWAMCGADMTATGRIETLLPRQPRLLSFTAIPRNPMHFELDRISTTLRPSPIGDRDDPATQLVERITRSSVPEPNTESTSP